MPSRSDTKSPSLPPPRDSGTDTLRNSYYPLRSFSDSVMTIIPSFEMSSWLLFTGCHVSEFIRVELVVKVSLI